eukprot:CAMPEP_0173447212 /NCGR_PEP_ID=MMETSP1357-20121228/38224_1 /TAXON_ID=77926 /ORGANISM="Hemiselmis rufescens, Strain PCC563" /LENGTH=133 /DNA_ID=CAMNT_0014413577 /DNA_START=105 /DNA_END=502 /DNA_ORIENTATION=+
MVAAEAAESVQVVENVTMTDGHRAWACDLDAAGQKVQGIRKDVYWKQMLRALRGEDPVPDCKDVKVNVDIGGDLAAVEVGFTFTSSFGGSSFALKLPMSLPQLPPADAKRRIFGMHDLLLSQTGSLRERGERL